MPTTKEALQQLSKLSPEESLAILDAIEAKRKKENYIAYWEPTPAQLEGIKEWTPDVKVFGILGGNRSGKTDEGAVIAMAFALGKEYFKDEPVWEFIKDIPIPPVPNNIWIVGLDFPTIRDVIWGEKLYGARSHPQFMPKDEEARKREPDFQIFFKNGSSITCKSADSGREKFQGASVDLIWIDEEPEVEIYDECYQRTSDCAGKILITLTPLKDSQSGIRTPWVFDLYEETLRNPECDIRFVKLSVLDNPHIPEGEKTKLIEKWQNHSEGRARLYGDFIQRSGLVYNTWDPKVHLVKPFTIPRSWFKVVSIDPAPTGITAGLWGAADPEGNLYLYREYYERNKTIAEHSVDIKIRNMGDVVDAWILDPRGGFQRQPGDHKTIAMLYRENGIPVRAAYVGEDYGMAVSQEYMNATTIPNSRHPKVFVFNDLHNFRNEIEHYVWGVFAKGEMKGLSKEKPLKRNDHLLNAYQYMAAMRPKAKISPNIRTVPVDEWHPEGDMHMLTPHTNNNSYF